MKQSRFGQITGNIIFYALVIILVFIVLGQFGVLPFRLMYIQTGSMSPTYLPGDAVLIHVGETVPVKTGDVILFYKGSDPIIHRIVSIDPDGIMTRGDANDVNDVGKLPHAEGKVLFGIPKIGYAIAWIQSIIYG